MQRSTSSCLLYCLLALFIIKASSKYCYYTDITGYRYDLTTLERPNVGGTIANHYNSYYYKSNSNSEYFVNVCNATAVPWCADLNSPVCNKQYGKFVAYGNAMYQRIGAYNDTSFSTQPPKDGGVTITYTHGPYDPISSMIRESALNIRCDNSLQLGSAIIDNVIEYQPLLGLRKLSIIMRAKEACKNKEKPNKCAYDTRDGTRGGILHFSTLTLPTTTVGANPSNNYNSYKAVSDIASYYINVCADANAPCSPKGGSCVQYNTTDDNKYYNTGNIKNYYFTAYSDPSGDTIAPKDGGASLHYIHGQLCSKMNPILRRTTINFRCNATLPIAHPIAVYAVEYETCKYSIVMQAKEACIHT